MVSGACRAVSGAGRVLRTHVCFIFGKIRVGTVSEGQWPQTDASKSLNPSCGPPRKPRIPNAFRFLQRLSFSFGSRGQCRPRPRGTTP